MKKLITLALCALFAIHSAEARTLYVNASRPNNKGNGLKLKTAKKTIQAAINVAKKGDTILVYPGKYSPIKTNNKKITIKSVKGMSETFILSGIGHDDKGNPIVIADLAAWSKNVSARQVYWNENYGICLKIGGHTQTTLQGVTVRPTSTDDLYGELSNFEPAAAVAGGVAKNCAFEYCSGIWRYLAFESNGGSGKMECTAAWPTFLKTKLVDCRIFDCAGMEEWYKIRGTSKTAATPSSGILVDESTLDRCAITQSGSHFCRSRNGMLPDSCNFRKSTFSNCLFARNWRPGFMSCTLGNCTVAGNYGTKISGCTAYNTVFYKVASSQFAKKRKNKLVGCYRGSSPRFVLVPRQLKWGGDDEDAFVGHGDWLYDEASRLWVMIDAVDADYHLAKGSPCIDKGTKKKAAKKLFGKKDLTGKKRVRGKSVDIGCYEYFPTQVVAVKFLDDIGRSNPENQWILFSQKTYSQPKTYGDLPTPRQEGRLFAGWWTDPFDGRQVFASSAITTHRLFAHWIEFSPWRVNAAEATCEVEVAPAYSYSYGIERKQSIDALALAIPSNLYGLNVVAIYSVDEDIRDKITSVSFPSTIAAIYEGYFNGCPSLSSIRISNGVTSIGYDTFRDCASLKTVYLQQGSPLVPGTDFWIPDGCSVVRY